MITLAVFDLAGTVLNEENAVYKALHKTLFQAGYDITYETVLAMGAGMEKRKALEVLIGSLGIVEESVVIDQLYHEFKDTLLFQYAIQTIHLFDDVKPVFHYLHQKGIKTVINTGYDRLTADFLLDKTDWKEGRDFDFLVTASDVSRGRPAPDMILLAMDRFNVEETRDVMKVGDSAIDIVEGNHAGCGFTIGVTTGAHTREQLNAAHPTHIIDRLLDITEILQIEAAHAV